MTKQLKEIEIPFGAKDSELYGWEYTIPEGMEATIVDNKIVVKKKESKDERIRKALLNEFIHLQSKSYKFAGLEGEEIVAWLEKQGEKKSLNDIAKEVIKDKDTAISFLKSCGIINENGELADEYKIEQSKQNPTDKVEPKFKVGDWIVYNRNDSSREILYVYDIRDGRYYFNDNIHFSWSVKECDEKCHLWTIDDVKSGDVVAKEPYGTYEKPFVAIYKERGLDHFVSYCFTSFDGKFNEGTGGHCLNVHPATKEQCEQLEKAMVDAGYTFDFDKKELKEIEQNPTWSEEDENYYNETIAIIDSWIKNKENDRFRYKDAELGKQSIDWLKFLKERYTWKPSDTQMGALANACDGKILNLDYLNSLYQDLKKLREE